MSNRRVVVTGLGLVTALGLGVEENWKKLLAGVSGIRELSLPQSSTSPIQAAGEIGKSDWEKIRNSFPEDASAEGERRTLFALWASKSALEDAGILDVEGNRERYGTISAAGLGIVRLEDIAAWINENRRFDFVGFRKKHANVHRESIIRNNANRPAALISTRFSLHGPCCTVTSACASATQAIGLGYRNVRRGDEEVMLAGGSDSMINPVGVAFFHLLTAASVYSGDPRAACRPFDRKRSGLVIGEGAGFVVLEELNHALERGARIYAEIVGYGSSMDAFRVAAPDPQGRGAARSMRNALRDAAMNPWDIDYINAHGTGTRQNDLSETIAIKRVFKEHATALSVSSSKSMIGHLMAASGGPEFIYTVLSVRDDKVHPTINLFNPDPKCDLDYVPNRKRTREVRAALSNSFGFGGQNATIAVKKYVD
jgi:3-oxoacyl-[acyl-carrier-protein] synthase II